MSCFHLPPMSRLASVALLIGATGLVGSARRQPAEPQPAQRLNWSADDAKRIARLHETGRRSEGKFAVLWTPDGALDAAESAKLIERLDQGVAALRKLIGSHPWQAVRDERIVFYVSDDQFVSHATGTEVLLIPLARLRDGRAPFFHEAAHALFESLDSTRCSSARRRDARPFDCRAANVARGGHCGVLWQIRRTARGSD
jgi:hypothetical protein